MSFASDTERQPRPGGHDRPQLVRRIECDHTSPMVALHHTNQDACKGATLTINFISKATTKKPGSKKRKAKR